MSNAIKWALLAAAAVALIALIGALPFVDFIDISEFSSALSTIVTVVGTGFTFARGLINNFLSPFGRTLLSGLLFYLFGKFFITLAIKISAWVYHFVFRG